MQANRAQLLHESVVATCRVGLALQRPELAPDLAQQVGEPQEVAFRRVEATLGLLLALAELEDARGLLDDAPPVFGPSVEHGVELPLADDHVLLPADARVGEELLDVEQPARRAVDLVLGLAGAEQRAGDRDLGEVDRQQRRGVVDRERHLGAAERRSVGGAREDDVVHLAATQRTRALGAEHPRDGVDDVGLARAVRPDHDGHARFELERGLVGERLEATQRKRLQEHGPSSGADRRGRPPAVRGSARTPRSAESEPRDAGRLLGQDLAPVHPGAGRALPAPPDDAVDRGGRALQPRLDPAVGEVAHPTRDPELRGLGPARVTEPHSLDPAGDEDTDGDALPGTRQTWHASQKKVERLLNRCRTTGCRQRRHDSPSRS